jgi:hypothetical protein
VRAERRGGSNGISEEIEGIVVGWLDDGEEVGNRVSTWELGEGEKERELGDVGSGSLDRGESICVSSWVVGLGRVSLMGCGGVGRKIEDGFVFVHDGDGLLLLGLDSILFGK